MGPRRRNRPPALPGRRRVPRPRPPRRRARESRRGRAAPVAARRRRRGARGGQEAEGGGREGDGEVEAALWLSRARSEAAGWAEVGEQRALREPWCELEQRFHVWRQPGGSEAAGAGAGEAAEEEEQFLRAEEFER